MAKIMIKDKADGIMEENLGLELNKEQLMKMNQEKLAQAIREKRAMDRTNKVIQKHPEFMASAKEYCHRNPTFKLSSIFDLVKNHRRGSIKITPTSI